MWIYQYLSVHQPFQKINGNNLEMVCYLSAIKHLQKLSLASNSFLPMMCLMRLDILMLMIVQELQEPSMVLSNLALRFVRTHGKSREKLLLNTMQIQLNNLQNGAVKGSNLMQQSIFLRHHIMLKKYRPASELLERQQSV